jgi:hypothetical protein
MTSSRTVILLLLIVSSPVMTRCIFSGEKPIPVAKVYDKTLYLSDIVDMIPDNIDSSDSVMTANLAINKWIIREIKLKKAENIAASSWKELERQMDEYRSSLIIHRFEQEMISQNLDTGFTSEEIMEYYNDYSEEFLLRRPVVKALVIQVPERSIDYRQFKRWVTEYTPSMDDDIREYCREFAVLCEDFNKQWINVDDLIQFVPNPILNIDQFIANDGFDEYSDGRIIHLIKIIDYKLKGERSPLMLVEKNIRNILLNKRKLKMIRDFEQKSFDEAMNSNKIEIFTLDD